MGCKLQASNHGLVFLVTSPHPGALQQPTQSSLKRTKDVPSALTTWEITKVLEILCQKQEAETKVYFSIILSHTSPWSMDF